MIDKNELNSDAAASLASADELARRLIDCDATLPQTLTAGERRSLAWALKDACYSAWSSEPRRAEKAAKALHLLSAADLDSTSLQAREIGALAAWTAGIAQITQGQMADATASFDLAASAFRELGQIKHAAETQVPKIMALSLLGQHAAAADCAR